MFIRRLNGNGAFDIPARTRALNAAPSGLILPARAFTPVVARSRIEDGSAPAPTDDGGSNASVLPGSFGIGGAGRGLERVLEQLALGMRPATSVGGSAARAFGRLDVTSVDAGASSSLASTRAVTERTSTVRSSLFSLGLDVATPASFSRLAATRQVNEVTSTAVSSGALGLDLNRAEEASSLVASREVTERTSTVRASSSAIGLDARSASSQLASTGELNGASTSYDKVFHSFQVGTSSATLGGVYTGSGAASGASTLTIDLGRNSTISSTSANLRFHIKDQSGSTLFTYDDDYRAGETIDLGPDLGLTIEFSAGTIRRDDFSSTGVSSTAATNVNPSATFDNADRNLRPRFEGGAGVVAGSFNVNGTSIDVLAGDSVSSVLARINGSGAGVTATFADDRVTLQSSDPSEANITVGGDTSGFLAATRLDGATGTPGFVADRGQALAQVAAFSGVSSGSFSVNGTAIAVDTAGDSLDSVIARINDAGAGVTASYDAGTDRLSFIPDDPTATLDLGSDSTGLLAALRVNSGRQGTKIDPTAALGGGQALLDDGVTVGNGSFDLNGVSIAVGVNDSLNDLLGRINASAAGVTASYDAGTDRVSLTSNNTGATPLTLANDSSGLLAALKLTGAAGAVATAGTRPDDREVLNRVAAFSAVGSGGFTINGVAIAVDGASDSLESVIGRINGAGTGVTAALDRTTGQVSLTPATAGATLAIGNDPSGLLSALGIQSGVRASQVNLTGAFDDAGVNGARLEPGQAVTAGAFAINGQNIAVGASDSIQTVLDRINASNAGVTASFDAQTETVALVARTAGPQAIELGPDSSGFLAAVKLDGAPGVVASTGTVTGDDQRFADSPVFGAVQDGAFDINGVSIAVSRAGDSLNGLLARINGAGAGVTASYDTTSGKVVLTPHSAGATLSLGGDSSGFLAAAGLPSGALGSRVNSAAAFDGSGGTDPLFDDGRTVGAGSFSVNGVQIDVAADDSLDSVLGRINDSAAGVTASYDPTSETIRLQRTAPGADPITLGPDSSGFLAATKLDGALASTVGTAPRPLATLDGAINSAAALAGVQAGTITINGRSVSVDPMQQSVREVFTALGRLPDVFARVDGDGQLQLSSRAEGGTLAISDSSGLLAALEIAPGTYSGRVGSISPAGLDQVGAAAGKVADAVGALNDALGQLFTGMRTDSDAQAALRGSLKAAFDQVGRQLGSTLTFVDGRQPAVVLDGKALEQALSSTGTALTEKLGALQTLAEVLGATRDLPAPAPAASTPISSDSEVTAARPALVNPLEPPLVPAPVPLPDPEGDSFRIEPGLAASLDRRIDAGKSKLVETTVNGLRQSLEEAARLHEKRERERAELEATRASNDASKAEDKNAGERSWTWNEDGTRKGATGAVGGDGQKSTGEVAARRAASAYDRARAGASTDWESRASKRSDSGSGGAGGQPSAPRFTARAL